MKEKFNCTDDYNESLKTEIIARVNSYYENLSEYRKDVFYWKISAFAMALLIPIFWFVSGLWMTTLPGVGGLLLSLYNIHAAATHLKRLLSTKCVKTERLAKIFRQERAARKEFFLKKLFQKYSNNLQPQ